MEIVPSVTQQRAREENRERAQAYQLKATSDMSNSWVENTQNPKKKKKKANVDIDNILDTFSHII